MSRQPGRLMPADPVRGRSAEQVGAAACDLAELSRAGGLLIRAEGAPAGVTLDGAGQPGHDQAVRVRSAVILRHLARIERGNDKSKLGRLVPPVALGKEGVSI